MFLLFVSFLIALSVAQLALVISLRKKVTQMRVELDKHARGMKAVKMLLEMVSERAKSRNSLTNV